MAAAERFPILKPDLQVAFYFRLQDARGRYLREALRETIGTLDVVTLDKELALYVPAAPLRVVAVSGIRGEVLFPIPCVLAANPYLVGYYRLLLGFSQKECYAKGPFGRFKMLEEHGRLTAATAKLLPPFAGAGSDRPPNSSMRSRSLRRISSTSFNCSRWGRSFAEARTTGLARRQPEPSSRC